MVAICAWKSIPRCVAMSTMKSTGKKQAISQDLCRNTGQIRTYFSVTIRHVNTIDFYSLLLMHVQQGTLENAQHCLWRWRVWRTHKTDDSEHYNMHPAKCNECTTKSLLVQDSEATSKQSFTWTSSALKELQTCMILHEYLEKQSSMHECATSNLTQWDDIAVQCVLQLGDVFLMQELATAQIKFRQRTTHAITHKPFAHRPHRTRKKQHSQAHSGIVPFSDMQKFSNLQEAQIFCTKTNWFLQEGRAHLQRICNPLYIGIDWYLTHNHV